ncbi:MAG: hypothetical protein HWN79_17005 [Candidatus Lokiarchaeota archaeon]|nr:hypothetical protein [Candidatus Lokiarchaeota archaeon]
MRGILTLDKIYQNVCSGKASREEALRLLTSILNGSDNSELRIQTLEVMGKLKFSDDQMFKVLEQSLISDESKLVRLVAMLVLLNNFPERCEEVIQWAILHDKNTYFLKMVVDYLESSNLSFALALKNTILSRVGRIYDIDPMEAKFVLDWKCLRNQKILENEESFELLSERVPNLSAIRQEFLEIHPNSWPKNSNTIIENRHITNINLYGSKFELDSLPSSLSSLSNLEVLHISRFNFDSLPESVNKLESLKILSISDCIIRDISRPLKISNNINRLIFHGNRGFTKVPGYVWEFANRPSSMQRYLEEGVLSNEAPVLALLEILRGVFPLGGPVLNADCVIEGWKNDWEEETGKRNTRESSYYDISWYENRLMVYTLNNEGHVNRITSENPEMPPIGLFPEKLCLLKDLTELRLVNQGIQHVPDCIANLKQLEILNLGGNNLKELPKSITKLKNLKRVYIGEIEIESWNSVLSSIDIRKIQGGIELKTIINAIAETKEHTFLHGTSDKIKLPPFPIRKGKNYEHIIYWILYNNHHVVWSDLRSKPLSIKVSILTKVLASLMKKNYVIQENREYKLTPEGLEEYMNILKKYDLSNFP